MIQPSIHTYLLSFKLFSHLGLLRDTEWAFSNHMNMKECDANLYLCSASVCSRADVLHSLTLLCSMAGGLLSFLSSLELRVTCVLFFTRLLVCTSYPEPHGSIAYVEHAAWLETGYPELGDV